MKHLIAPTLAALAALSAPSAAQNCNGTGPILTVPDTVAIGELVTALMHADAPATTALLFSSTGPGPTNGGTYGTLCLDFPPIFALLFPLDANGDASFTEEIPCDPSFIGLTFYVQFITCSPGNGKSSHGSSNGEAVTIVDGIGSDSFCTYTQDDFNVECWEGGTAGCILENHFHHVFPNGILIGDQDGNDSDNCYVAMWDRVGCIETFLTQPTRCAQLTGDHLNGKTENGFKFGAELLVAKLNVGFDDAGEYDDMKCRDDLRLGELVFVACVDEDLIGWEVRDLIDLADQAICGALGAGPFDIDGDGTADVTCDDLMNALAVFNGNFRNCDVNNGCLGF